MTEQQVSEREGNGQGHPLTIEERKEQARAAIPVKSGQGITAETYGAFVTVAQGMCKPDNYLLPTDLRENVPVMIGILDIASRANCSSYLLAAKAYVQKGRLCFESVVFHMLAKPFIIGALRGKYVGEGEQRRLVVYAYLRDDPNEPYEHESPPLAKLHPGHVTKDGTKFVKGSPLWDRKPDMQLWYDTTRDWCRRYLPEAVLGVYTRDEIEESEDLPPMRDVTPPKPTLVDRLDAGDRAATGEGHRGEAHIRSELDRIAVPEPKPTKKARPQKEKRRPPRVPSKTEVKRAADRAEKRSKTVKARSAEPEPKPEQEAETPQEAYVHAWVARIEKAEDGDKLVEDWKGERARRDELGIPIKVRAELGNMIEQRADQLKGEGDGEA